MNPPMQLRFNFNTAAMVLAGIVLLEGLVIGVNFHSISIQGTGEFKESTVMLAGLQLAAIGAAILLSLVVTESTSREKMVNKIVTLIPLIGGAAILLEGIVVAYLAGPMVIRDIGSVQGFFISAFSAQLFMLGAGLVVLWLFRSRSVSLLINLGSLILVSSAGVMLSSVVGWLTWAGTWSFRPSTVIIAGIILVVLGLGGIVLYYLEGWKFLGKELFGMEVWSWSVLFLGVLIAFAGAVIISLSAPVVLADQPPFSEGAVALAGLSIFVLGLLSFMPAMLSGKAPLPIRRVTVRFAVFAMLLLPFAFLS